MLAEEGEFFLPERTYIWVKTKEEQLVLTI